jgi:hypothetical protein
MNIILAFDRRAMMGNTPIEFLTQLKEELGGAFYLPGLTRWDGATGSQKAEDKLITQKGYRLGK